MDFQTLNRRELQALCKLNKIPANITNIAMVDALKSLEKVEGIEEFLNPSRSETARLSNESPERNVVSSSRVPRTSCRTTTRQKAKQPEAESVHATVSRARRQLTGEANEFLKTPLVSSTRKKGTTTSTHQETLKKETTAVQTAYSTRRSTRLTIKKSEGLEVTERERSEPLKLDSFLDEVNDLGKPIEHTNDVIALDEIDENSKIEKVVHVDTNTLESREEKIDCCSEVDDLKVKSVEVFEQLENVDLEDLKPDSEGINNSCDDGDSEEKLMVIDEKIDLSEALNVSVKEQDAFLVPEEHTDANALSSNTENPSDPSKLKPEGMPFAVSVMKNEVSEYNGASYISGNLMHLNSENPNGPSKLDNHNIDEVMTAEGTEENISENKVDFAEADQESLMAVDVMPAIYGEVDQLNQEGNVDEVTNESSVVDVSFAEEEIQPSTDTNVTKSNSPALMRGMTDVSDNKENEENMNVKECDGDEKVIKSLNDTSLRQLKKQLKALSIKNNTDASCVTTTELENY